MADGHAIKKGVGCMCTFTPKHSIDSCTPLGVRCLLAANCITVHDFARACKLSPSHLSRVLRGRLPAGELTRIKMRRALRALGLERAGPELGVDDVARIESNGGER